ncbi:MAG: hypothetical protein E6Q97_32260 [Desulfurellales bacterium]|nr:MAG: hypothetical protein E6Q97_32260 [Desulfurellales bacterium]
MTRLYKLTDAQGRTRAGEDNERTWAVGVTHKTAGTGTRLCSSDVIHAYEHPLIAVLMNPIHAMLNPWQIRLFLAEGEIVARDNFYLGVHSLKVVEELPVPKLLLGVRVQLAIWAAKHTCTDASWNQWADDWLNNLDRSEFSAEKAKLILEAKISATYAARGRARIDRPVEGGPRPEGLGDREPGHRHADRQHRRLPADRRDRQLGTDRAWAAVAAAEAAYHFSRTCDSLEPNHWAVSTAFFTTQAVAEALLRSGFNATQIADVIEQAIDLLSTELIYN